MDPAEKDRLRPASLFAALDQNSAAPDLVHQLPADTGDSPAPNMAPLFAPAAFDENPYAAYSEAAPYADYASDAGANPMLNMLSPGAAGPLYHDYLLPHLFSRGGHDNSDAQSLHLLYSDALLMPASPFQDAVSHLSEAYSDVGNADLGRDFADAPRADEIMLGESVLTTNLTALGYHAHLSNSTYTNPTYTNPTYTNPTYTNPVIVEPGTEPNLGAARLTEDNLMYNESYLQQPTPKHHTDVALSLHQTPDVVAARTPSLFSKSSHELPDDEAGAAHAYRTTPQPYGGAPTSPARSAASAADGSDGWLLNPDEFHTTRRGRQKAHSLKVRSRSALRLNVSEYSDAGGDDAPDKTHLREKMLELASAGQATQRVQKHPSLYACHLCEKRFTRPYNLKSHLRTHTDERPFICGVCGKAFARQHDRKRHEDLHLGKKKFQCKGTLKDGSPYGCGRKFARADALRRHFQTESGKECIRLLVEEAERDQDPGKPQGIHLPDGEFLSTAELSGSLPIPQVAILPPQ